MSNKAIRSCSANRKGQLLTTDFMLSLAVFVALLLTIITIWTNIDSQVQDVERRRDMQSISMSVSDALIRSAGNPDNWENLSDLNDIGSVGAIGLAKDEHVLDLKKVSVFIDLDNDVPRYIETKSKMRLANYEVYLTAYDYLGYNVTTGIVRSPIAYYANSNGPANIRILEYLNGSGAVYDFYDANTGATFDMTDYDGRYYYSAFTEGFTSEQMFNFTINNQTQYRTIIIEEPNLPNSWLNITGLQEFLNRGGILVVKSNSPTAGNNVVDYNFSVHMDRHALAADFDLVEEDYLFRYVKPAANPQLHASEVVNWYVYQEAGDAEIKTYVANQTDHTRCLFCKWGYGWGTVYYIGTLDPLASFDGGQTIDEALNLVGERVVFGEEPVDAEEAVNVRRMVLLEGEDRQIINLNLVVWK
ncbi:MAG: hypothetical protein NT157_03510 [Candidatus Micrarchaeota archaeon]|nr:hypothetical protein [Candidatus Micrarchaeota archaeon]